MKKYFIYITLIAFLPGGCSFESVDPNAASEEEVLGTRAGLISACIGLRAYYSTNSLQWVIENNALTTHEVSVTSNFQTAWELEEGMDNLTSFNSNIGNQWTSLLKVKSMADAIIANVNEITATQDEKNTIGAMAYFYKAAATGFIAQFFTHVPKQNTSNSEFLTREQALAECVSMLKIAEELFSEDNIDQDFLNQLCGEGFNLRNSILVYLSRYQLQLGNDQEVLNALAEVDENAVSIFEYGPDSPNPVYTRVFGSNLYYQAVDSFGLAFGVDTADMRLNFYLDPQEGSSLKGLPIESLAGFYDEPQSSIPVYLPGEILLNRAEAFLHLNMPADAIDMINHVRNKTDDPFGINAEMGPYTGSTDPDSIVAELFIQRCIELYMSGLKLEDSRRLGQPAPTDNQHGPLDRSRNFYPFPNAERINNLNTPEDPPI